MAEKLFFVLLGCTPPGRNTEQHDVYFGIGNALKDLVPQFEAFWPEGKNRLHIDSWREVTKVDGYSVRIVPRSTVTDEQQERLFFLNLGGYKPNDLEEYHYKILGVAPDKTTAIQRSKQTAFYQHTGFAGANSHIDDKYGVDVDEVYEINDVLSPELKSQFAIRIESSGEPGEDELHIGYVKMSTLIS